jgi:hypothetical protein
VVAGVVSQCGEGLFHVEALALGDHAFRLLVTHGPVGAAP